MIKLITILEDDAHRVAAMRAALATASPGTECIVFDNASEMIAWFKRHLSKVALISLDHDLPIRSIDGQNVDCGNGRQVADFLAGQTARCPIIVHSSNANCASGMFFALKGAGWSVDRVYPAGDLEWVEEQWSPKIAQRLAAR